MLSRCWCLVLTVVLLGLGPACAPRRGAPDEFPPVHLGMPRAEVRAALAQGRASVLEDSPRLLRAAGRDAGVAEETFLFYDGRLAAWTQRLEQPSTRATFAHVRGRYTRCFGEPFEVHDDGLVLVARWRYAAEKGRVLLSGYAGDRTGQARLMVRVEDPSVVRSLIRQMGRDEARSGPGPDSTSR
jgi:hypothetical protein